jgi:hypothetical protein
LFSIVINPRSKGIAPSEEEGTVTTELTADGLMVLLLCMHLFVTNALYYIIPIVIPSMLLANFCSLLTRDFRVNKKREKSRERERGREFTVKLLLAFSLRAGC